MLIRDQGEKKRKGEKSGRKEQKRNIGTAGGTSDDREKMERIICRWWNKREKEILHNSSTPGLRLRTRFTWMQAVEFADLCGSIGHVFHRFPREFFSGALESSPLHKVEDA